VGLFFSSIFIHDNNKVKFSSFFCYHYFGLACLNYQVNMLSNIPSSLIRYLSPSCESQSARSPLEFASEPNSKHKRRKKHASRVRVRNQFQRKRKAIWVCQNFLFFSCLPPIHILLGPLHLSTPVPSAFAPVPSTCSWLYLFFPCSSIEKQNKSSALVGDES
jgi:hypothetical protein